MSSNSATIPKPPRTDKGFIGLITQYDALVVFGLGISSVIATILLTGIFQAGPIVRTNLLFNAIGAFGMAFVFIFVIYRFMGAKINILGKTIDIGLIIYICIVGFVIFIFGN